MEKSTMGTFLTALRRAKGMTQKELAEQLNVSDKAVSRWEREESYPDVTLLPIIADIFDVTVDELLRGERKSSCEKEDEAATERAQEKAQEKAKKRYQMIMKKTFSTFLQWNVLALSFVLVIGIVGFVLWQNVERLSMVGILLMIGAGLIGIGLAVFILIRAYMKLPTEEGYEELTEEYRRKLLKVFRISIAVCLVVALNFFALPVLAVWGILEWYIRVRRSVSAEGKKRAGKKILRMHGITLGLILIVVMEIFLEDGMLFAPHRVFFRMDGLIEYLKKDVDYYEEGNNDAIIWPIHFSKQTSIGAEELKEADFSTEMDIPPEYLVYAEEYGKSFYVECYCNSMYYGGFYRLSNSDSGTLSEPFYFQNEKAQSIRCSSGGKLFLVSTSKGALIGFAVAVGLIVILALWMLLSPLLFMKIEQKKCREEIRQDILPE